MNIDCCLLFDYNVIGSGCGGTAYTADLKSAGESLRVQISPAAPGRRKAADTGCFFAYLQLICSRSIHYVN